MQPGPERRRVTAAILLGMFLAALEATAVAAAVPTAVGELGGISHYSWILSAYLLTSTATVPLFGKLADLFGRKRTYQAALFVFLLGSALCGFAQTFPQLVIFRAIQGLGAGGVMPVAVTIVGDIYTLEERAKVQGLFSGVWALASLVGPLLGGLVTDVLSWRWIFFLNVPIGILPAWLLQRSLREEPRVAKPKLDILGTVTLTASVTALLLALLEGAEAWGWRDLRTLALLAASFAGLALFLWQERRAPEPMLPLEIFRNRLIAMSSIGNALLGALLFCLTAFIPMFGQGVLGGSAIAAGTLLTPVLIGWPIASTLAGRYLFRVGYRTMAIGGQALGLAATAGLAYAASQADRHGIQIAILALGFGLGFCSMPYLLGPQNAVPRQQRGVVTGSVQFFRNIGGAVAVAAAGSLLNVRLAEVRGDGVDINAAFDPILRLQLPPATLERLTSGLRLGLTDIFIALIGLGLIGLVSAWRLPGGSVRSHQHQEPGLPLGGEGMH